MITTTKGNILQADTEAIVNTVNTVGVMGKGIALQFKETFPENYKLYRDAVARKEIAVGKVFVTETHQLSNPKYIINFPTKTHWKGKSKYEFIEKGLEDLSRIITEKKIHSVSVPPLGCGNGGLRWEKVRKLIVEKLQGLKNVTIVLYEPIALVPQLNKQEKPAELTQSRALVLALIKRYTILGYEVTLLEIQKLAYFLQRFGEQLKLQYVAQDFGPYAYNLMFLLRNLEGPYLTGKKKIADTKPFDTINIQQDKINAVETYILKNCTSEQQQRLQTVYDLIQGFESPLGMELLATVDWIMNKTANDQRTIENTIAGVHSWNERKKKLMKAQYIKAAYDRLITFNKTLYANN